MNSPIRAEISRRFAFPAECVYDAWFDPEWIRRWIAFPDPDARIVRLGLEPRVGGKFSFVVEREGVEVDHRGEYLEVDRPDLLVFTWGTGDCRPASSRVVVEIVSCAGGCELTLTHVMAASSTAFADKAARVWHPLLAALADFLAEKTNPLILKAS